MRMAAFVGAVLLAVGPELEADHGGTPGAAAGVVELFTSQGCYSCPPADALLGELIASRPRVVALEFHVDYWDDLVYGSAGRWRDPFSDAAFSHRQKRYQDVGLEGRRGVYTPQMVVNGARAVVGSDRQRLYEALGNVGTLPVPVSIVDAAGTPRVRLPAGYRGPAGIWRVDFIDSAKTPVTAGENHGKHLVNRHIVTAVHRLATREGTGPDIDLGRVSPPADACAVLVQEPAGAIVGAAYCPR